MSFGAFRLTLDDSLYVKRVDMNWHDLQPNGIKRTSIFIARNIEYAALTDLIHSILNVSI